MPTQLLSRTLLTLALAATSTGCGAFFQARANVTPASARVEVRGDARTTAAAGLLASGLSMLAEGGAAASHPASTVSVHTPSLSEPAVASSTTLATGVETASSATVNGLATPAAQVSTTQVSTAQVSTAQGGVGGDATGLRVAAGAAQGQVAMGTLTYGRVTNVSVMRVTSTDRTDIVAGGEITLEGAPLAEGLKVLEGSFQIGGRVELGAGEVLTRSAGRGGARAGASVRVGASTQQILRARRARWTVTSGAVLVEDRQHRRFRCRITGGSMVVSSEGSNPSGNTVWTPGEGSLSIEVVAMGDERLALDGAVPSVETGGAGAAGVVTVPGLSPRALHALDLLANAAPSHSPEALRLAAAVDMVIRESQDPAATVLSVPITGRSVVLLVDVSYSMNDPDPRASDLSLGRDARPRKFDVARAELVKILGSVAPDVAVNIIAFSSVSNRLWQAPAAVSDAGLSAAVSWVAGLRVADETHPLEAFEAAAAMSPEQIVLVSDGRPSDREEVAQSVLGLAAGLSTRIRIDVIGIGPDQDRAFLSALAERGRGTLRMR